MPALTVVMDTVEPRTRYDRLSVMAYGDNWGNLSSDVYIDAISDTAFLEPYQVTKEWGTLTTGNYARLPKSSFIFPDSSKWVEHHVRAQGDIYLHGQGTVTTLHRVYTGSAYPANQPFMVSWFVFGTGNDSFKQMECGWVEAGTSVSVRVWSDGKTELWKGTAQVAQDDIVNVEESNVYTQSSGTSVPLKSTQTSNQANNRVDMFLVPYRRRELLVFTNQNGGFVHQFKDLDISGTLTPNITDPGQFWFNVPQGQAQVQVSPLRFKSSGTLISDPIPLRYAPITGQVGTVLVYYGTIGTGSVSVSGTIMKEDLSGTFLANGTLQTCRLKLVLNGSGAASPAVYAANGYFTGSIEYTSGSAIRDVTSYVLGEPHPRFECSDDPAGVKFSCSFKYPETLEGTVSDFRSQTNRPLEARIGSAVLFGGRVDALKWSEAISDEARRLNMESQDRWKAFEKHLISDPEPVDGSNLGTAFAFFASYPGYGTANFDIDTFDLNFPVVEGASKGEWGIIPEVGDTPATWLKKLHEDYAGNAYMGWKPYAGGTVKFFVKGTASLGTTPAGTLYATIGSVLANSTAPDKDTNPWKYVYRSYDEDALEVEANDITVTGMNPRTKQPIQAHYEDPLSIDPTLQPSDRPLNWLGERRKYGLQSPDIISQEVANWAIGELIPRLTVKKFVSEWSCQLLINSSTVPSWRGDVWRLDGKGNFRIVSFDGDFITENAGTILTYSGTAVTGTVDPNYRDFHYIGEFIGL